MNRASEYSGEFDGGCLQMRISYSPAAPLFLFLFQWANCNLASAFGLIRILVYKTYDDGKTTVSRNEHRASLREFYAVILPSLMQLQRGMTELEARKQAEICAKYKRRICNNKGKRAESDAERDEECGICLEIKSKVVLPRCGHSMCIRCYRSWQGRSESCPFCRDNLKGVNSADLWVYPCAAEVADTMSINRENLKRLVIYVDKLPWVVLHRRTI